LPFVVTYRVFRATIIDTEWGRMSDTRQAAPGRTSLLGSFTLAYASMVILMVLLVYYGGVWNLLANTRLLDLLIRAGVIAYHDDQIGFVLGVNEYGDYLKSQDPVSWSIIAIVFVIFWFFWSVKGVQFHLLCRFYGIEGSFADHARALNRGVLYNSYLPYRIGDIATADTLKAAGSPADRAAAVVHIMDLFVIFEIVVFAFIALPGEGWGPWLMQLLWSLIILGVAAFLVRRNPAAHAEPGHSFLGTVHVSLRELANAPRTLVTLCLLSLVAFGVEDIAAYLTAMAFTGDHVKLHVEFSVLLMGVCGSYIARFIPITPGGVGQFEWGFATALYIGGVGLPEAVTIGVLDNVVRYVAFLPYYAVTSRSPGETSADSVFDTFTRVAPEPVER
jgi:uncharacterized membrane protein YbhN (UPF0104 family)